MSPLTILVSMDENTTSLCLTALFKWKKCGEFTVQCHSRDPNLVWIRAVHWLEVIVTNLRRTRCSSHQRVSRIHWWSREVLHAPFAVGQYSPCYIRLQKRCARCENQICTFEETPCLQQCVFLDMLILSADCTVVLPKFTAVFLVGSHATREFLELFYDWQNLFPSRAQNFNIPVHTPGLHWAETAVEFSNNRIFLAICRI
jgi:hypothetical protein